MKNTGSVIHMIGIDIRRGVCNKRFWIAVAVLEIIFVAIIVLDNILAVQQYYEGGVFRNEWYAFYLSAENDFNYITNLTLFGSSFPLFGAIAYAYSIVDDRKHSYYRQIVQKNKMQNYYWSRMIASGIMGGIFVVVVLGILILMLEIGINYNPFLKDVVQFYKQFITDNVHIISCGNTQLFEIHSEIIWELMVGFSFFIIGILYGLFSTIIAFLTDNRVIVYVTSLVASMIYTKGLYAVILLFHKNPAVERILWWFMFQERMGGFDNLIDYSVVIFLIVLMIFIAKIIENKVMVRYMEGGCEE